MKQCPRCKETKSETNFDKNKSSRDGIDTYCKICRVAYNRNRKAKLASKGKCVQCGKQHISKTKFCLACRVSKRPDSAARCALYKNDAILKYGGKCACCGESRICFLTIDHTDNTGAQHRRSGAAHIYRWLKVNNYPNSGFQVLCYNCNCAKQFAEHGERCPHEYLNVTK